MNGGEPEKLVSTTRGAYLKGGDFGDLNKGRVLSDTENVLCFTY